MTLLDKLRGDKKLAVEGGKTETFFAPPQLRADKRVMAVGRIDPRTKRITLYEICRQEPPVDMEEYARRLLGQPLPDKKAGNVIGTENQSARFHTKP